MTDDRDAIKENRRESAEKIARGDYDVFISYNYKDWEQVKAVLKLLRDNGISYFIDREGLRPGFPWQSALYQQITSAKSATIFVGQAGMGPTHEGEMYTFEREFNKRGLPVIPVLLPDIAPGTKIPNFLEGMTWVDFRKKDPDPLELLIKGITGKQPEKIYRPGILVASLGESPAVITSMYRLLTEKEQPLTI